MKKYVPIPIIVVTFLIGLFSFPYSPAKVATHWGVSGQADGFSPKLFGTFFVPVLMIAMYFLFLFLPSTDPYKKNFNQFRKYYNSFIVLIYSFFSIYMV